MLISIWGPFFLKKTNSKNTKFLCSNLFFLSMIYTLWLFFTALQRFSRIILAIFFLNYDSWLFPQGFGIKLFFNLLFSTNSNKMTKTIPQWSVIVQNNQLSFSLRPKSQNKYVVDSCRNKK